MTTTTMADFKPTPLSDAKWQRLIEAGAPLGLRDDARVEIEGLVAWWRHLEVMRLDDDDVKPKDIRDAIEAAAKDLEREALLIVFFESKGEARGHGSSGSAVAW